MKNNLKKILLWTLVVIWMIVIFNFSNMDDIESNEKSMNTIDYFIDITTEQFNNKEEQQKLKLVYYLNYPIRKVAHIFIYFVLAILLLVTLKKTTNIKNITKVTLIICFIYACTDEYHQTFINGRNGQFLDVIIDTIGVSIYILIYKQYIKKKEKKSLQMFTF